VGRAAPAAGTGDSFEQVDDDGIEMFPATAIVAGPGNVEHSPQLQSCHSECQPSPDPRGASVPHAASVAPPRRRRARGERLFRGAAIVSLGVVMSLGGYVAWTQWRAYGRAPDETWQNARLAYQRHQWNGAKKEFAKYAKNYPDTERADE